MGLFTADVFRAFFVGFGLTAVILVAPLLAHTL
jgi:hypothetical protein